MVVTILQFVFAGIALACIAAGVFKRSQRASFIWAGASAGVAAIAAYNDIFWLMTVTALMIPWALVTATRFIDLAWRVKAGLVVFLVLACSLSIYPTAHDQLVGKIDLSELPPEQREQQVAQAEAGDLGLKRYLLANIPFRLVRGLDLAGGLRLVYNVDVSAAIEDKRDRYFDVLRDRLAVKYGFTPAGEVPTNEHRNQVNDKVTVEAPPGELGTVKLTFADPAETQTIIDDEFVASFLGEMHLVRASDGSSVTFTIRSDIETRIREQAVEQAKQTILRRIDTMGLKEAAVSTRDEDIIVEVPGDDDDQFDQIRDIISKTARLEFKLVDDNIDFFGEAAKNPPDVKGLRFEPENVPLGVGKTSTRWVAVLIKGEQETMLEALDRFKEWTSSLDIPDTHEIGFEKRLEYNDEEVTYEEVGWRTYYMYRTAELTGDMVQEAVAQPDPSETGFGNWIVSMEFDAQGADAFDRITTNNIQRRFAIILDDKVESAPVIQSRIAGGRGQITLGAGSPEQQRQDARQLELVLKSGALPAPLVFVKEDRIGPILGADSIKQGLEGGAIGGALVLIAMIILYARAGVIANIAVLFNLTMQIAILSMFNASLTLPGIAGLALTIGIAVDANVLINERIREELRLGKSARSAVDVGYERAFSAIIDGNVTTLISGLILFQYGTGPIKGFAVTLVIGMLTNLFTGVIVTRLMFDWAVRHRRVKKLSLG